MTLDLGVFRLVSFLRDHGFNVISSGMGDSGGDSDLNFPFVVIETLGGRELVQEADRLYFLLRGAGVPMQITPSDEEDDTSPFVEVYYNPATGEGQILLGHVFDARLPPHLPKPLSRWRRVWKDWFGR